MITNYLYSLILELVATSSVPIPTGRGDQTHALFLHLVEQIDPDLSRRLHDDDNYRPFTVSRLSSPESERKPLTTLRMGSDLSSAHYVVGWGPTLAASKQPLFGNGETAIARRQSLISACPSLFQSY